MASVETLLQQSEESLKTIRALNEIASNPILNPRSHNVVVSQMYSAIHEFAENVLKILADPVFVVNVPKLEAVSAGKLVGESDDEEEEVPKKSLLKSKMAAKAAKS